MSTWPPPQHPHSPAPAPPIASQRQGCGRAIAVTLFLILGCIGLVALLSNSDSDLLPVMEDSVGVVRIEGPITSSEDTVKLVRKFRKNDFIKAIVLRLETPGGGVAASEEIYREALKARTEDKKPVIVSMGSVAASGGYYIASASQHIFATSGTITGSIGVISPMFDAVETLRKLGIKEQSIVTGEHKGAGDPFDGQTTSERVLMQGVVNDMYRQFFSVVLKARHEAVEKAMKSGEIAKVVNAAGTKVPGQGIEWTTFTTGTIANALHIPVAAETALRTLADGRVYTGEQGLNVGLVDSIGTLEDAVDYAGKKSGLGADPAVVDRKPGSDVPSWLGASTRRFLHEASATNESIQFRSRY